MMFELRMVTLLWITIEIPPQIFVEVIIGQDLHHMITHIDIRRSLCGSCRNNSACGCAQVQTDCFEPLYSTKHSSMSTSSCHDLAYSIMSSSYRMLVHRSAPPCPGKSLFPFFNCMLQTGIEQRRSHDITLFDPRRITEGCAPFH